MKISTKILQAVGDGKRWGMGKNLNARRRRRWREGKLAAKRSERRGIQRLLDNATKE